MRWFLGSAKFSRASVHLQAAVGFADEARTSRAPWNVRSYLGGNNP